MSIKKKTVRCSYCGGKAVLRDGAYVHGSASRVKHLYVCSHYPECNAYAGVDERTLQPLGPLADGDLRHKRIEAHRVFDRIWKYGIMSRDNAYRWMQDSLGLNSRQAHIAQFSDYLCDTLIAEALKVLRSNRIAS